MRVVGTPHRATSEHHVVLRQRPCLVGEDVLNLSEILADVESPTLEGCVGRCVVHATVPVDEVDLNEFNYLKSDIQ